MELWTAISFGLLGSFHCIGMCGPIAFALPLPRHDIKTKTLGIIIYNLGRVVLYTFLGIIVGFIGKGLFLSGFQQIFSITLGTAIVLISISPSLTRKIPFLNRPMFQLNHQLKSIFQSSFKRKGIKHLFIIGLINGLLPCGLVYMALAGSLITENAFNSARYMFFFGLGTIPLMAFISISGQQININIRNRIKKIIPVIMLLFGLLFILRGMNLGIPFVSPAVEMHTTDVEGCIQ